MAKLAEIVDFLDHELDTAGIPDYPGAWNGLQLENDGEVTRVIAAVDASLPVIEAAAAGGPGLLLVHHGLFWQGVRRLTGGYRRIIKKALDSGIAIYSSHLPLDFHPEWGNNRLLADAIGVTNLRPFLPGTYGRIGLRGDWSGSRDQLIEAVRRAVGGGMINSCPAGPETIGSVGIVTGGGGSEVEAAHRAGVDAFITGEGSHWTFPLAQELGANLIYGGHYATETFGVRRLMEEVGKKWALPGIFLDHPSGL